ncbi:Rv3235 family protein [Arthrobacter ruber]|uniref:Rv3235 family protein n=1 Tax=Arthrobacter ruber TaxID=1258893 RepID=UPI001F0C2F88|nr:Rv3235 family protein [Arthrobacter ruber]
MHAVTQLHRTATEQLAEVSGSPRPLLAAPPRGAATGPAPVIDLHPAADPYGPSSREEAPEAGAAGVPGGHAPDGRQAAADQESVRRISAIARSVTQGALEVLGGSRPLQQLSRWLDPENYERLQLRANLVRCIADTPSGRAATTASAHRRVVVRSARVCPVSHGIYEASVVAYDQKRVRAVALRIEQRRGAWRVTALEIG